MKPQEVLEYYVTKYRFNKATGISHVNLYNWLKKGCIPEGAQLKLERITNGQLKAEWDESTNTTPR